MDEFFQRLIQRTATIDEILSDDFEALPGQKGDADLAARRLAAWCRSCASGDWSLFNRRLERDGLSIAHVLERFATVRRRASDASPPWINDAIWIDAALQSEPSNAMPGALLEQAEPASFEHVFAPLIEQAEGRLWTGMSAAAFENLTKSARACLAHFLLHELSRLCAPLLYENFANARTEARNEARKAGARQGEQPPPARPSVGYDGFVADMKAGGFRRLFERKPVLLRLIATLTRQWIDTSRELVTRLEADLDAMRREVLHSDSLCKVAKIEGDLSDAHNGGRSVRAITFEDGMRVIYKPKDLRLDLAWYRLVERLNQASPPIELRAMRVLPRDGYGWTEFIEHVGCVDGCECKQFFRRAGAWLALFHCCGGTDMHQENIIAHGGHPVPIDLEMLFQPDAKNDNAPAPEERAFEAAVETLAQSVATVGLLPNYLKSARQNIVAIGGLNSDWQNKTASLTWSDINSDNMRPVKLSEPRGGSPNLPHICGRYAKFGDHVDDFVAGFEAYAEFLSRWTSDSESLLKDFADLPVRKTIRPTNFYALLLQRLKNHRSIDDGVLWSAQADFLARLADWDKPDPAWPLQRAERSALLALNVPHFTLSSTGNEIGDAAGISVRTEAISGLDRARTRTQGLDAKEIAWQMEVIRQNTITTSKSPHLSRFHAKELVSSDAANLSRPETFLVQVSRIAEDLAQFAIHRAPGAAWIGLEWFGDAEVVQLMPLGFDLYNGVCGIGLFLAAHSATMGSQPSGELALAAISSLRRNLSSRNAARMARALGVGGFCGLGSIVYALTIMSKSLGDAGLLADAEVAADLFTDDLIAQDRRLDVLNGSAGAILGLLRLYRETRSEHVLERAIKCGEHLLLQERTGQAGRRTWIGEGIGPHALAGMSHGAAGFAYALAALAAATGREQFSQAAAECIAYENSYYSAQRHNWPDLRGEEQTWPCQWCHGGAGIGLARIGITRLEARTGLDTKLLATDIRNAVHGARLCWPPYFDTLCCGSLGTVELLREAASTLGQNDLREHASRLLMTVAESAAATGDYRWNSSTRKFNLGLFRGLAGVGYTLLRQVNDALPNVLMLN